MKQLVIFSFLQLFAFCSSSSVVQLENGDISGTSYELPNGRIVHAFFGVPYAAPPIHKFRFKEPQILKPWTGVWNASIKLGPCLQYSHVTYSVVGEEDCLYVNVFTPKLSQNGVNPLLDVLVYFHGGAFMFGSGNMYLPDYILMNNDIVTVTVNYRLGPLGFLSTGDDVVPGNNGLKDQSAALKWVHHNIIKFGGNPASVTISGGSAGGASVQYHFLSTFSDAGFFQKGISLSGSVLPPWTLSRNNTEKSFLLVALLGCPTTTTRDAVNCLRKRSGRQIVQMVEYFQPWRYNPITPFGPTIEPEGPNAFLSEEPAQLLSKGLVKHLPWLIGLTKDEGLYPASDFARDEHLQQLESSWEDIAPHIFAYNFSTSSDDEKKLVSQAIKKYYFNNEPVSKKTFSNLVKAVGDRLFYNDIIQAASLHASVSQENVFCYLFNYRGKYSLTDFFNPNFEDFGVSHSDDIQYIFNFKPFDWVSSVETESDAAMVEYLGSIISRFMKTGNPNSGNRDWQPLSKSIDTKLSCLFINSSTEQSMEEFNKAEEIEFWKNILPFEHHISSDPTLKDEL